MNKTAIKKPKEDLKKIDGKTLQVPCHKQKAQGVWAGCQIFKFCGEIQVVVFGQEVFLSKFQITILDSRLQRRCSAGILPAHGSTTKSGQDARAPKTVVENRGCRST